MRSKVAKMFKGIHLDYGVNDGHVTRKLFGAMNLDNLYVADIENKLLPENALFAKNFLIIDPQTSRINNEGSRFDSVSCIHVIEHVPNFNMLIIELNRQLRPGGLLYLEAPNNRSLLIPSISKNRTWNFFDDPSHIRPYTSDDLSEICRANGFKVINAGIYRDIKYALAFPVAPMISLLLRDWRPIHYSTIHLIGWSSFVLCEKV
jgi:2-polyprenyl-3-methyl-5-hydroxy-6-metoxy-1,4-benzoquinol methylase